MMKYLRDPLPLKDWVSPQVSKSFDLLRSVDCE